MPNPQPLKEEARSCEPQGANVIECCLGSQHPARIRLLHKSSHEGAKPEPEMALRCTGNRRQLETPEPKPEGVGQVIARKLTTHFKCAVWEWSWTSVEQVCKTRGTSCTFLHH